MSRARQYLTSLIGLCLTCLIAASAAAEVRDPYGVAIIIGNKTYSHDRVPEVSFAHRDADAFKAYVVDVLGYDPANILDLRDANQAQMFSAFGNHETYQGKLWRYVDPKGRSDVVVYYSGHGVPGQRDGRGYLLPANADPETAEINGYPIDRLYENLGKIADARSVSVFLDACFSGDSQGGRLIEDASPVFIKAQLPGDTGKLTVLTAASGIQLASWDKQARHGLFTEHLLDALYGKGDADSDGRVTAAETKTYLDDHMTRSARRVFGRDQEAGFSGARDRVLATAKDGSFPSRPTQLASLSAASSPTLATGAPDGSAAETALQLPRADKLLIQRGLNNLQLDAGPADGLFGPMTRSAIRSWQSGKGFAETGYLDNAQAQALVASGREVAVASAAPTPVPPASSRSAAEPQVAVGVFPKRYQPGQKFRDCADCPEMVVVPAGSFRMGDLDGTGSSDEKPVHDVRIGQSFAVGVYEVTFAEWDACVGAGGCGGHRPNDQGWGRGNRPVINVIWDDAQAYVSWLSRKTGQQYRLLSEAEWEYVTRAGTTTAYSWGNQASHEQANYGTDDCCDGLSSGRDRWVNTSPVGSFSANAFGLHDVHGNVYEWTEDCWHDSYAGAPTDGGAWTQGGDCSRRVLRGGSWLYVPWNLRSAARDRITAGERNYFNGFRLARTLFTP